MRCGRSGMSARPVLSTPLSPGAGEPDPRVPKSRDGTCVTLTRGENLTRIYSDAIFTGSTRLRSRRQFLTDTLLGAAVLPLRPLLARVPKAVKGGGKRP